MVCGILSLLTDINTCLWLVFSLTDIEKQQESPSPIRKRKSNNEKASSKDNKRLKTSLTCLNKKPDYQIGPSSWIRKEIETYTLEKNNLVSSTFVVLEHLLSLLKKQN